MVVWLAAFLKIYSEVMDVALCEQQAIVQTQLSKLQSMQRSSLKMYRYIGCRGKTMFFTVLTGESRRTSSQTAFLCIQFKLVVWSGDST